MGIEFTSGTIAVPLPSEEDMAYFAKLDENNLVIEVHCVSNDEIIDQNGEEQEQKGVDFLVNWSNGHPYWKQTSYNRRIRKNCAGVGYTYDPIRDAFIPDRKSVV